MKALKLSFLFTSLLFLTAHSEEQAPAETKPEAQWENLLAGTDVNALWCKAHSQDSPQPVGTRWELTEGVLSLDNTREGKGGSIETKKTYDNFELKFEFNIQKNCNGGVKYRLKNSTGLEFQIIDDLDYKDNKTPSHRTAGLYEIKGVPETRKLNPAGEWNTARIIANGNTLEHWLNEEKVLTIEFNSAEWKENFEKSKYFKQGLLDFATHKGPIHLQDHSDTIISFRNMLIKEL